MRQAAGGVVFDNLALLFALGVAVGLAKGDGVAAIAAFVGYMIMNVTMGQVAGVTPEMAADDPAFATVLGVPTIQTGVFGGIIIGVLSAWAYTNTTTSTFRHSWGSLQGSVSCRSLRQYSHS